MIEFYINISTVDGYLGPDMYNKIYVKKSMVVFLMGVFFQLILFVNYGMYYVGDIFTFYFLIPTVLACDFYLL